MTRMWTHTRTTPVTTSTPHAAMRTPALVGGAALLLLAGAGHIVDSLGASLAPGSLPEVAVFTFGGEVLLWVWLLLRGRTVEAREPGAT